MLAVAIGANWYWHAGFLNDRKSSLKKTRRKSMCVDVSANKFPLNADIRYKRSVQHFGTCRGQLPLLMATLQAVTKLQFHWLKRTLKLHFDWLSHSRFLPVRHITSISSRQYKNT